MGTLLQLVRKDSTDARLDALWEEQEQLSNLSRYVADRQRHIEIELLEILMKRNGQ